MNRTEALQTAFNIAGPNVTAEEHIQYAEFLLGEHEVRVGDYIMGEDTHSICDDPREYTPHEFIGDLVYGDNWDLYPVGAVALDYQGDVWHYEGRGAWSLYEENDGSRSDPEEFATATVEYWGGVFVA